MNIFSRKCYFRTNLQIDVTKNRIFWGISLVNSKSEIHSPGNFLLVTRSKASFSSTADTYKICAKSGKGFRIGTNETYNIKNQN